jgi:hypothetical protein
MQKKLKSVLLICASLVAATAVSAAIVIQGPNGTYSGDGVYNDGDTFVSLFASQVNSSSIKVLNNKYRNVLMSWDNKNDNAADVVLGAGWGWNNQVMPKNISYKVDSWSITRGSDSNNGVFGVYGWSCAGADGIKKSNGQPENNVEFYVVDRWLGSSQWIPYDGASQMTAKETFRANGADYKIYQSSTYQRANACGGNDQKFHQVWAVRQGKKTGTGANGATNVDMATIGGKIANYGYITQKLRYIVVGIDAFKNAKGSVQLGYVDRGY